MPMMSFLSRLPATLAIFFLSRSSSSYAIPEYIQKIVQYNHKSTNAVVPTPPIARREEDRVIYAGIAPSGWDPQLPRQAANSTHELMDPPVPIPDPYGWLRDDARTDQEMLDYLKAENDYTESMTSHLIGLQDDLYDEFLSSLQETDYSTPRPKGDWMYYSRTFQGSSYAVHCRAPRTDSLGTIIDWDGSKDSPILPGEEMYLDVNELAKNQTYCNVGSVASSPSQDLVAYTVDYSGSENYEVHIRHLKSGDDIALTKTAAAGGGGGANDLLTIADLVWGKDDNTLYYTTMDEAHRPYQLYVRKNWKSENFTDTLLKEESDNLFSCYVDKSFDEKYIFFGTASKETSEVWYIDLSTDEDSMKCVSPRKNKVLYDVEGHDHIWYIVTNVDNAGSNMKFMSAPATPNSAADWELVEDGDGNPIFDGSLDKSLDSATIFKTHAVLEGREDGIPRIWTYSFETKALVRLEFDDAAYDVGLSINYEVDADKIAIGYSSMLTPPSSIEISLNDDSSQRTVLKTKAVPGYEKGLYGTDRLDVLSRDGKTRIPISIVYSKDVMEKVEGGERVPVHLYGYGAYGDSVEAGFDSTRLPLLKRGMIYVIAHVRGGGELGQSWYEEPNGGKLLCKKNTFNDFVDVANFLVANYTAPDMLSCEGRSAGGLLIGASINQAPELFRVAILGVPFVDVAVTMTDASIPLTSEEWIEWGNPNEQKYFQYMMDYSPMNNVQKGKKYPACWVTGGLHDPRVAYWEPSKFTATLRHSNPNNEHPVCMKLDLHQGHFSSSDRYKFYKELASDYSFLLDQLDLA